LVGWWKLDEGSGTTAGDSSSNGNIGTLTASGVNWTGGPSGFGSALSFDGSGWVSVSDSPSLNCSTGLTLAAWVNVDSWVNPCCPRIISKNGSPWDYTVQNGSALHLSITIGGTFYDSQVPPPPTGAWHHVAATYDGSAIRMYLDGVLQTNVPATGTLLSTSDPVYVGYLGRDGGRNTLIGLLDDVRIYNRGLSEAEIWALGGVIYTNLPISLQRSGDTLILTWSSGTLLSADDLGGPWTFISGATSPLTITPSAAKKFYRLKQ